MNYKMQFGGGAGDVFSQLYYRGAYNVLRDLAPEDAAEIILVTHNPYVREFFDYHPNHAQFNIRDLGYWDAAQNEEMLKKHNLVEPINNALLPEKEALIRFYPAPSDKPIIKLLQTKAYITIAAGAGLPNRTIPLNIINEIIGYILCETNYDIVITGRNYDRHGRAEPEINIDDPRVHNLVDKLSFPGTAIIVQNSLGLVTAHSALNILGWYEQLPQLLLYPQAVLDRHAPNGNYDQWLFGAKWPITVHGLFEKYTSEMCERFIKLLE